MGKQRRRQQQQQQQAEKQEQEQEQPTTPTPPPTTTTRRTNTTTKPGLFEDHVYFSQGKFHNLGNLKRFFGGSLKQIHERLPKFGASR